MYLRYIRYIRQTSSMFKVRNLHFGKSNSLKQIVTLASKRQSRFVSFKRAITHEKSSSRSNALPVGLTVLSLVGVAAFNFQDSLSHYHSDVNINNETPESIENSVSVDKGVPPFSRFISEPLESEQELIGYGVRTVTFLRMKVYALGIYVSKEDIPRIATILKASPSSNDNLLESLKNPKLSMELIETLLDSGIKFTAHIVPLRNTDFNHLRDGLIKSIMACPKSKEVLLQKESLLPEGLDELRKLFGSRKGSCPKGHSLFIELQKDKGLAVKYQEVNQKTGERKTHVLGQVKEPMVGKLLFLQYLSGPNPLSRETRDVAVEKIAALC